MFLSNVDLHKSNMRETIHLLKYEDLINKENSKVTLIENGCAECKIADGITLNVSIISFIMNITFYPFGILWLLESN